MLAFFILAGLIGEAVLFKGDGGQYRRISRQALAYAAYGALFGLGAYVTIYVYGSDYLEAMYDPEMRERMAYFAYSPVWIIGSAAFSFILTLLGSLLAAKLLRKHFMKSGLIK